MCSILISVGLGTVFPVQKLHPKADFKRVLQVKISRQDGATVSDLDCYTVRYTIFVICTIWCLRNPVTVGRKYLIYFYAENLLSTVSTAWQDPLCLFRVFPSLKMAACSLR